MSEAVSNRIFTIKDPLLMASTMRQAVLDEDEREAFLDRRRPGRKDASVRSALRGVAGK